MCYVINQELSKSSVSKFFSDCNQSFNFQYAEIILNANNAFESDFLANLDIYLNLEVIVNEKSDSKKLCVA